MRDYVILFIVSVVILFLLYGYLKWRSDTQKEKNVKKAATASGQAAKKGLIVNCPLCKSLLLPGEDLVSRVYRPMNVPDQLCTINGCPHCYPVVQAGLKRECPVCHKEVPLEKGHLVARLFNYQDGKKHVVVTGCTECCKHSAK